MTIERFFSFVNEYNKSLELEASSLGIQNISSSYSNLDEILPNCKWPPSSLIELLSDNLDESDFQYFIRNMETPETHKIHRDSGWKMLSTILYLSDDGDGTMFFDSELGTNLEEVEWRPNRLVSFIPSSTSWHSFKNSGQITRSTIQFTLYNKEYSKDEGNLDE